MAKVLAADEVRALAHLARLEIEPRDVERLAHELGEILDHVACLGEVDTAGVEPMTHAVAMTLRLRDDVPGPCLPPLDGGVVVPAIIGGD
ncbi:MAG: Asp-tRNA(Asn)/Glu-tRNA(Gln) amidotransferase subunit GatC [Kofleriaceae bacterium]